MNWTLWLKLFDDNDEYTDSNFREADFEEGGIVSDEATDNLLNGNFLKKREIDIFQMVKFKIYLQLLYTFLMLQSIY